MGPRLICDRLTVQRTAPVLQDVCVTLDCGRIHAVCGPNGAGKSTLLAACAGDLKPTRGSVAFDTRNVRDLPLHARAQHRAVLAQNPSLNHPFSCRQVINLGSAETTGAGLADTLLKELGCEWLAPRMYTRISGGEQRLVQLLRVLAQAERAAAAGYSPWLLLDEPTSQLDLGRGDQVIRALQTRTRRGWGVLLALHDLELASRCADQLLLLNQGRLLASGTPAAVLTPANLLAGWGVRALVAPDISGSGLQVRTLAAEDAQETQSPPQEQLR